MASSRSVSNQSGGVIVVMVSSLARGRGALRRRSPRTTTGTGELIGPADSSRRPRSPAAVGHRDDLHAVAGRIEEVQAAAAVVVVDLVLVLHERLGVVRDP